MSRKTILRLLPALAALLLCSTAPALAASKTDPHLSGDWQLDPAASDNFDAKLTRMAEEMRARFRNRHNSMLSRGQPGAYGATDEYGQVPGLVQELPSETHDELRDRLAGTYRPPSNLQIRMREGEIIMLGDTPPERRYSVAETVTRMDVSGTAELSTSWSGNALVIVARYTNRSRSDQRYSVDRTGDVLSVTVKLSESNGGTLQLHSTYRRITPPAQP